MRRFSIIFLLFGCDGSSGVLDAHFLDEIVGAPARTAEVLFVAGSSCEALLSVQPGELDQIGQVLSRRSVGFPIGEPAIFEDVPRGRLLSLHVTAFDETGLSVGRGCNDQELARDGPLEVTVELHALPQCDADWRFLDIGMVIDTTTEMAIRFAGNEHLDALEDFIGDFEQGTQISIVTHGHTQPPAEYLTPTADNQTMIDAVAGLKGTMGGQVELFRAVTLTSRLLRSRAICGRRPVLLVVEAGRDTVGNNIPVTDAQLGLFATSGDSTDDLYIHGIFATPEARSDLEELFDGLSLTGLSSGATVSVLQQSLIDVRFAFDSLIVR